MHLNMSKFKKLSEDKKSATFQHPDGHKITVAKHVLSPEMKKQLSGIPVEHFDAGGEVQGIPTGTAVPQVEEEQAPSLDPIKKFYNINAAAKNTDIGDEYGSGSGNMDYLFGSDGEAPKQFDVSSWQKAKNDVLEKTKSDQDAAIAKNQQIMTDNRARAEAGLPPLDQVADAGDSGPIGYKPISGLDSVPEISGATPVDQPAPQDPNSPFSGDYLKDYKNSVQGQLGGINDYATAKSNLGNEQAGIYNQDLSAHQKIEAQATQGLQDSLSEVSSALKDYKSGHIDPDHHLNSMGTGQKISTAIGLILGGLGGGLSGQGNPALDFLNKQIQNDVESQAKNLDKSGNLVGAYMKQYNNLAQAKTMAHAVQSFIVADQINAAAAKSSSPMAIAQGKIASNQLVQGALSGLRQMSLTQAMMNGMSSAGGFNPQSLDMMRIVNPELAKSVEQRYVPGVGVGSVPIPEKEREGLTLRNELDEKLNDLKKFAKENEGSLNPAIVNAGKTKASAVQDLFRRATAGGVFREAEKNFVDTMVDQDPTKFFSSLRTIPKYDELIQQNEGALNQMKKSYGLPVKYKPSSAVAYKGR